MKQSEWTANRTRLWTLKASPKWHAFSSKSTLLKVSWPPSNSTTNWGTNVQILEAMGDIQLLQLPSFTFIKWLWSGLTKAILSMISDLKKQEIQFGGYFSPPPYSENQHTDASTSSRISEGRVLTSLRGKVWCMKTLLRNGLLLSIEGLDFPKAKGHSKLSLFILGRFWEPGIWMKNWCLILQVPLGVTGRPKLKTLERHGWENKWDKKKTIKL